jgi:hypothetical protein
MEQDLREHISPTQLAEAQEFANKFLQIYKFIRFGGKLDGAIITDLANNHCDRPYSITQLLADAIALEDMARDLRKQAQAIANKRREDA